MGLDDNDKLDRSLIERMEIRPATSDDLPLLQEIEVAAGVAFAEIGMAEIADHDPPSSEMLGRFLRNGRAWVQAADGDEPVAYLIADLIDGALHIEQVSVDPSSAGRGLGRGLIEHAAQHAEQHSIGALTLTTFAAVPWNQPYYERLGFRVLSDEELTPGLRSIRAEEVDAGLDRWPRVCMVRPV